MKRSGIVNATMSKYNQEQQRAMIQRLRREAEEKAERLFKGRKGLDPDPEEDYWTRPGASTGIGGLDD